MTFNYESICANVSFPRNLVLPIRLVIKDEMSSVRKIIRLRLSGAAYSEMKGGEVEVQVNCGTIFSLFTNYLF